MPATPVSMVKPFCFRMPVRYFCVSNSWKPSSPKLKTMSIICWPRSYIDCTSALAASLSFIDAGVGLGHRRRQRRRRDVDRGTTPPLAGLRRCHRGREQQDECTTGARIVRT